MRRISCPSAETLHIAMPAPHSRACFQAMHNVSSSSEPKYSTLAKSTTIERTSGSRIFSTRAVRSTANSGPAKLRTPPLGRAISVSPARSVAKYLVGFVLMATRLEMVSASGRPAALSVVGRRTPASLRHRLPNRHGVLMSFFSECRCPLNPAVVVRTTQPVAANRRQGAATPGSPPVRKPPGSSSRQIAGERACSPSWFVRQSCAARGIAASLSGGQPDLPLKGEFRYRPHPFSPSGIGRGPSSKRLE